jgi:hypothetical protein
MKTYKSCQSCGMPLSKDELGGGTEQNGAKSIRFCSHCYMNGEFTLPDLTADEMKDRVKQRIVDFGMPKFMARFFTRNIHKLERWNSDNIK